MTANSEKTGSGKTVTIVTQQANHPWWVIATEIARVLSRYGSGPLRGYSVGVFTPRFGLGALGNPIVVANGEFYLGITTPTASAWLAMEGAGPFKMAHPNLRAIANYPHHDCVLFALSKATGISSLDELVERRYPLRLATGRKNNEQLDMVSFVVDEVLKQYGGSFETLQTWGGQVTFAGKTTEAIPLMISGQVDAVFNEAQMMPMWDQLIAKTDVNFLSVNEEIIDRLDQKLGLGKVVIGTERFPHLSRDIRTVGFGGWLLFGSAELPDEIAYKVTQAAVETRETIEKRFGGGKFASLAAEIRPQSMCRDCLIPLHPGAEAYYRDCGYL
jgi:TRAP-type uncharacterized transport system substrate-binding protein